VTNLGELIESAGRQHRLLLSGAERRRRTEKYILLLAGVAAGGAAALIAGAAVASPWRTQLVGGAGLLCLGACLALLIVAFGLDQAKTRSMDEGATMFLELSNHARQLLADGSEYGRTVLGHLSREHALLLEQYKALTDPPSRQADGLKPLTCDSSSRHRYQHTRLVPRELHTRLSLDGGETYPAKLINVSMSGASLAVEATIPAQAEVTVGRTRAKVVRNHDKGVAVEFLQFLSPRIFNEDLIL
jgi:hypothetical protein